MKIDQRITADTDKDKRLPFPIVPLFTRAELKTFSKEELLELKLVQQTFAETAARLAIHPQSTQACKVCRETLQERLNLRIIQQIQHGVKRLTRRRLLAVVSRLRVLVSRHRAVETQNG